MVEDRIEEASTQFGPKESMGWPATTSRWHSKIGKSKLISLQHIKMASIIVSDKPR